MLWSSRYWVYMFTQRRAVTHIQAMITNKVKPQTIL